MSHQQPQHSSLTGAAALEWIGSSVAIGDITEDAISRNVIDKLSLTVGMNE